MRGGEGVVGLCMRISLMYDEYGNIESTEMVE